MKKASRWLGNTLKLKLPLLGAYIFIAVEDSSRGVHNPSDTKALLEASIEAVKQAKKIALPDSLFWQIYFQPLKTMGEDA